MTPSYCFGACAVYCVPGCSRVMVRAPCVVVLQARGSVRVSKSAQRVALLGDRVRVFVDVGSRAT